MLTQILRNKSNFNKKLIEFCRQKKREKKSMEHHIYDYLINLRS